MKNQTKNTLEISRKEALQKIGNYGKYAALTALGTYLILNPKKHKQLAQKLLELDFNNYYVNTFNFYIE